MNPRPIFDQAFHDAVSSRFVATCTIQSPPADPGDQDAFGAAHGPRQRTYTDKTGHVGLACAIAPETAQESRQTEMTLDLNRLVVLINGCYPTITDRDQAVVDGATYEIQGVVQVQKQFTRLSCRVLVV